ncbi:MAG: cyclic nucleotide-binding domain-containing protein [Nocardioides sp.]
MISIRGVPTIPRGKFGGGSEVSAGDLEHIVFTAPLSAAVKTELAASLDVERVGPSHPLVRAGGTVYALGILLSGTAALRVDGALQRRLGPGDWFGELGALPRPDQPLAILITESVVTAYVMETSSLRSLMRRVPEVVDILRTRMAQLSTSAG